MCAVFSSQKGDTPSTVHRCTNLKVTVKTNVPMELIGRLLAVFWIPVNFHRITKKHFLERHFLQLEGCFVPAQTPHLPFLQFPRNFFDWLLKGNTAYPRNFVWRKSDPLVEAVKITDVTSENVVQDWHLSGRESIVSARDLSRSPECYSDTALNEQQAVVSKETKNTSNSQNKTITVQLLMSSQCKNVNVFMAKRP